LAAAGARVACPVRGPCALGARSIDYRRDNVGRPDVTQIRGIHHFTYGVGAAQEDHDFHHADARVAVPQEDRTDEGEVPIYHLYYGNAHGDPGAVLTSLPMRQQGSWDGSAPTRSRD